MGKQQVLALLNVSVLLLRQSLACCPSVGLSTGKRDANYIELILSGLDLGFGNFKPPFRLSPLLVTGCAGSLGGGLSRPGLIDLLTGAHQFAIAVRELLAQFSFQQIGGDQRRAASLSPEPRAQQAADDAAEHDSNQKVK